MPNDAHRTSPTQELKTGQAQNPGAFIVNASDWERLRDKVRRIQPTSEVLSSVAYVLFGIAFSAGTTALATLVSESETNIPVALSGMWLFVISSFSTVIGIIFLYYYHHHSPSRDELIPDILQELELIVREVSPKISISGNLSLRGTKYEFSDPTSPAISDDEWEASK